MKSLFKPDYIIDNRFLDTLTAKIGLKLFLIILNRPINQKLLFEFTPYADKVISADGASNRLYASTLLNAQGTKELVPDVLVGDFDSIHSSTLSYYRQKGTKIVENLSQDNNDFEKCAEYLFDDLRNQDIKKEDKGRILIFGASGGRLDHFMCNIHVLHKMTKKYLDLFPNITLSLIDDHSMSTCIPPGKTEYLKAPQFEKMGGVGIFGLTGESSVQTSGFKWNLSQDQKLDFLSFISSSNEFEEDTATFDMDSYLFFTTTCKYHNENN